MKVTLHSNLQNSSNLLNDFLLKWKHNYASSKASHQACNNFRQVISWNPSTVTIKRKGRSLSYIMEMKTNIQFLYLEGQDFPLLVFFFLRLDTNDLGIGTNLGLGGFSSRGDEFILIYPHCHFVPSCGHETE